MTTNAIQEDIENFVEQLNAEGLTAEIIDVASKDNSSKWKTYYRPKISSGLGLLVVHPSNECDHVCQSGKLEGEVQNYKLLRDDGFKVPEIFGPIKVYDPFAHIDAVALIVEHIDGSRPFKPFTELRSIKRWVTTNLKVDAQQRAEESWKSLQTAYRKRGVQDLQIIITYEGEMFVIDPEATTTTPTDQLPLWNSI